MGLRFDPVGGGQFKQAVQTIIEAESQPLKQLETRKAREESKLKLFQEFKSKFAGFENAINDISSIRKLRELKVDLGDGKDQVAVTVDKEKAEPGTYSIDIKELAAKTSILSNAQPNPDEALLGMGFITMDLANGESIDIFVDEDQSSLRGIANLINSRSNLPVRAAVVKDESDMDMPWRLIVTAKKDGQRQEISFPQFYFLGGQKDFYIDDDRTAQNAIISMEGFDIELPSNNVEDFLPGVNLQLKQANPDHPFTITISEDYEKMAGKMKALVDQMNGVLKFINQQNQIDDKTDTRSTFAGDTSLQSIEYRLRNLMHEGFQVPIPDSDEDRRVFLTQLGIEFEKSGSVKFSEEKFTKFLQQDFDGLAEAISGEYGFAFQLRSVIGSYTRPGDGLLASREQGLRSRINNIDQQIDFKQRALERRQQSLVQQFSRLEAAVANMQRQQQYLSSTLGGGGGGNPILQLLGG